MLLALLYTEALTQLGISLGVLHVEDSEDESAIQDQPRFVLYHGAVTVVRPRETLTRRVRRPCRFLCRRSRQVEPEA